MDTRLVRLVLGPLVLLAVLAGAPAVQAAPSAPIPADARAAAAAAGGAGIGTQASWSSGTLAPGASQHWVWNNASIGTAYAVGLSPYGATTSASCRIEVTQSYYARDDAVIFELEFRFRIENVGTVLCSANILLSWKSGTTYLGLTPPLDPGQTFSFNWNNAAAGQSHVLGLSPLISENTDCSLEVDRQYYVRQADGEREVRFRIANIGATTCSTEVFLGFLASTASWNTVTLSAGSSTTTYWNNANPLTKLYVPGLQPSASNCKVEVTRTFYVQRLNTGVAEREFHLTIKNVGSVSCYATILLASLTA